MPLTFFGGVDISGNLTLALFFGAALVFGEAFELPEAFVEALLKEDCLLMELALFCAIGTARLLLVVLALGSKEVILRGKTLPPIRASALSHSPNLYPLFWAN